MLGPPLNFRSPLNLEKISGDPQNDCMDRTSATPIKKHPV